MVNEVLSAVSPSLSPHAPRGVGLAAGVGGHSDGGRAELPNEPGLVEIRGVLKEKDPSKSRLLESCPC